MNLRELKDKLKWMIFGGPQGFIDGLLDRRIHWALRDDYATYLIEFDEPEVEEALLFVASDPTEDDDVAESCGESIAEIWCRKDTLKLDALRKLKQAALNEALPILKVRKPEWLPLLRQEGLLSEYDES